MATIQERRAHRRFEIEVPVTLRVHGKLIPAASLDVSLGGISVLIDFDSDLQEGPVEIVMDLSPNHRDVSLMGRILRFQKEYGKKVGIQFVEPKNKELNALDNFLNSRYN